MPRNRARNPTQMRISAARAGKSCCDAQNPSRSSRIPVTRPSHQNSLRSFVIGDDDVQASLQDEQEAEDRRERPERVVWTGERKEPPDHIQDPERDVAHFQLGRTTAIIPSFSPAMRNTTPRRAPTVAIDVVSNRSTINPMISPAIPVMRNNHQTPVMAPNIEVSCVRRVSMQLPLPPRTPHEQPYRKPQKGITRTARPLGCQRVPYLRR